MTHLGQRLSALIDGELDGSERQRVLLHMAKCGACQDEAAALRTLKRRMNALGEAAANAALTGRLMSLGDGWPAAQPAGAFGAGSWTTPADGQRHEQRSGRYFLAGALAVVLAGLGTAAFVAGGESQAQAPTMPVSPSVDVMVVPHQDLNGAERRGSRSPLDTSTATPGALMRSPARP